MRREKGKNQADSAFNITSAPVRLSTDQSARQRRYFISMMIRTACFILTVLLPSPFRWFALLGAAILPYVAVVMANAGRETVLPGASLLRQKNAEIE
jgi:Flp pilus assembly protein TadB